jgi:hypothetical protein
LADDDNDIGAGVEVSPGCPEIARHVTLFRRRLGLEIEKAVVEFATEATLRYRAIAGIRHDNQVPESFLRSHVASRLHDRLACPVHVDRLYAAMAVELGVALSADLVTALDGARADIAIYRDDRPAAVIELGVFDEVAPLPAVGVKLDKAKLLARLAPLQVLLGVMVCPIILSLEARIERLHDAVGGNLYVGERQPSRDGQWQWCFACASIS